MLIENFEERGVKIVHRDETRVVLIGKRYTPEPTEPVWGSEYGCAGTVIEILGKYSDYDVKVKWDNDYDNSYEIKDLRLSPLESISNPNITFRLKKRTIDGQKESKQDF